MASWQVVLLATASCWTTSAATTLDTLLGVDLGASAAAGGWGVGGVAGGGSNDSSVGRTRVKRQLIDFPDDAVMEFIFKLVVPYWTYGSAKASGDYRFELTYELPNQLLRRRRKRSLAGERTAVYGLLGDSLSKAGLDGEACMLRAVCEVGESPLEEYGMFGEFLNLIFTPGFGAEDIHHDYIEAEDYGRSYGNCWSAFPDCPMSMREMLHEFFLNNADIPKKD
ncbi:uncharacterized protein LOC122263476 [Penaeus japonicus]|uniref:uncharacterized protein LOC122263476 n=1 Tax=Penaeus japonicus TaxID=27405 RepID=UPI001C70DD08|nr:uncharacterized protein LOC122263476 [Penaeus japonicus]